LTDNNYIQHLHEEFIRKVEKRYGKYSEDQFRFKNISNSEVARDLNYSDAQFSRLIHLSASEGEYKRAIRNIDRILNEISLQEKLNKAQSRREGNIQKSDVLRYFLFAFGGVLLTILFYSFYDSPATATDADKALPKDYTLQWSFESAFVNPYTKLSQLPEDCYYPCYKYQGRWELKNPYKIPFFRERNGFHYLATEVNMYGKCAKDSLGVGTIIEGYEYQKHEIWFDKRKLPIDSFFNDTERKTLNESYQNLDFTKNANFIRIAYVHTFFKNDFFLFNDTISRAGKVIGRDIELIPTNDLLKYLPSEEEVSDLTNQLNKIVYNRLQDFSRPINCQEAIVPNVDFHDIKEGDEISFKCTLTTGRFPIEYEKTYIFVDQYIENQCQSAEL
jgi:hypothetical protein